MKKYLPLLGLLGLVLLFLLIFYLWGGTVIDGAVKRQESVNKEWSDVQAQYQRRADLIPQLVSTVKGAIENEKEILIRVTEARSGIIPGVNAGTYTPSEIASKTNQSIAQAETPTQLVGVWGGARRLLMENYPEIKSIENFQQLQRQLEGTENRVAKAREDYNEAVSIYNTHVRGFFKSKAIEMLSDDGEFSKKEMFEALDGNAEYAPDVNF